MTILDALKAEFEGEVQFHSTVPATFTAPSIVVAPGDPFLEPGTHGMVTERWEVLVVFNSTAPDRNVDQMRKLSLRVRSASAKAGAMWESTSAPRRATANEADTTALVVNRLYFRYEPLTLEDQ